MQRFVHYQRGFHRSDVLAASYDRMCDYLPVLATFGGPLHHYWNGSASLGHLKVGFCFHLVRLTLGRLTTSLERRRSDCDGDASGAGCHSWNTYRQ